HSEREPEAGARTALEREHRVRRVASEPGTGALVLELCFGEGAGGGERTAECPEQAARAEPIAQPEQAPRRDRVRPDEHAFDLAPSVDERRDELAVGSGVPSEPGRGALEVALERDPGAV